MTHTAIILAGGKSSRMGFDKQQIRVGNSTITEYLLKTLGHLFEDIIVVTNNPELYKSINVVTTEDIYKNIGPMAGIHAGLKKSKSESNYIIACDMPFINKNYIKYLQKEAASSHFEMDALLTKTEDGMIETMNGFYSKKLVPVIEKIIEDGKKSILDLLAIINVVYVEAKIVRRYSPDWGMFTNLNTVDDLKKLSLIEELGSYL